MYIRIGNKEISIWQIMFYVSWTVLTLWLILKIAGVIKTPFWLEYGVPVGSIIIGVFGIYHNFMQTVNKVVIGLATLTSDFKHLNFKVDKLDSKVNNLDTKVNHLDLKVNQLDSKFNHLELDMEIVKNKL